MRPSAATEAIEIIEQEETEETERSFFSVASVPSCSKSVQESKKSGNRSTSHAQPRAGYAPGTFLGL